MAESLDFSAFKSTAEILDATRRGKTVACGWIPPHERTAAQKKADAETLLSLPRFSIRGRFAADKRRYPLWAAGKALTGKFLKYNWQQTGSCVGAGGDNALKTRLAIEILLNGDAERFADVWWPFAYGRSRYQTGIRGRGEGSTGYGWAKAATTDGFFEDDGTGGKLPDFKVQQGWLVLPGSVEMDWSDGGRIGEEWLGKGRIHLVKTMAPIRNKHEAFEAIANGYPLTQASSFGFRSTKVMGTKQPIRVATWNGTWNHQTYVDETWDHPELSGIYFRWGNNWGPDAHGAPTGDEPPGGVYVHEDTMDQICKEGEVFAISGNTDGFPAGDDLDFGAF